MKLVQVGHTPRSSATTPMERVNLFNPTDLLWRYPVGFQAGPAPTASYPFLDFRTLLPNSLAGDPRLWSREDVLAFLRWCEYEFDLPRFDMDFFQMNGKALCLLTKSDLNERSPGCGDVLHNVLHMLMRARGLPSSPLTPHFPLTPTWSSLGGPGLDFPLPPPTSQAGSVTLSPAPSVDSQGSPRQPDQANSYGQSLGSAGGSSSSGGGGGGGGGGTTGGGGSSGGSALSDSEDEPPSSPSLPPGGGGQLTGNPPPPPLSSPQPLSPLPLKPQVFFPPDNISEPNTNGRLLWDFLQQLLNDPLQRYTTYIAWKNRETGVFKIVDPPGLAKLWGIQKNHLSMNYDKLSRALRYYYRGNILRKVQGERHCYQFLRNPSELKNIKHISLLRQQIPNQPSPPAAGGGGGRSGGVHPSSPQAPSFEVKKEIEEEPTDLSTHGANIAELKLSLKEEKFHHDSEAQDLSLSSQTRTITAEVSKCCQVTSS